MGVATAAMAVRSRGRWRAAALGALFITILARAWCFPVACFVAAPGRKHQLCGLEASRRSQITSTHVEKRAQKTFDTELMELWLASTGDGTPASESTSVWDQWFATPGLPDATDAVLSALGAGVGLIMVGCLDDIAPVRLYAPPLASSAFLIFSGTRPPPLQNVLVGTAGSAAGSVMCSTLLSQVLPSHFTSSLSVVISLVFSKFTGFFFPPAAALAALGVENEAFAQLSWSYILFPAVTGNALLYGLAMPLSSVRDKIRAELTAQQWRMGARDETLLKEIFERCDLDGNGLVDHYELKVAKRYLIGKAALTELTGKLMSKVDSNADGLDFTGFTTILGAFHQSLEATRQKALWQ